MGVSKYVCGCVLGGKGGSTSDMPCGQQACRQSSEAAGRAGAHAERWRRQPAGGRRQRRRTSICSTLLWPGTRPSVAARLAPPSAMSSPTMLLLSTSACSTFSTSSVLHTCAVYMGVGGGGANGVSGGAAAAAVCQQLVWLGYCCEPVHLHTRLAAHSCSTQAQRAANWLLIAGLCCCPSTPSLTPSSSNNSTPHARACRQACPHLVALRKQRQVLWRLARLLGAPLAPCLVLVHKLIHHVPQPRHRQLQGGDTRGGP